MSNLLAHTNALYNDAIEALEALAGVQEVEVEVGGFVLELRDLQVSVEGLSLRSW